MARIRTIKPEFWAHPLLGKLDDATKLMAIALLNYADDHGYFHAEPNLVRGFCRPFDDNSTITRRCLENLAKIEYISVCTNEDYGLIGYIENFTKHQRVDRPNDSKLVRYYSTNDRRMIDEASTPEKEGKRKGKGKGKGSDFVPPSEIEIINYFLENGYKEEAGEKMFKSYSIANWIDSKGNKVLNWKQKAINVWFTEENKVKNHQNETNQQKFGNENSNSSADRLKEQFTRRVEATMGNRNS